MKLLIVLGLFPLFSAQRFGFDFGGFGSGNNGYQGKQGNNGYQGKQGNNGYQGKQGNSENLPGVDRINNMLISQLKSMTNSLTGMMKEVADNPQARPTVDTMFDTLANGCVTNMDEAIQVQSKLHLYGVTTGRKTQKKTRNDPIWAVFSCQSLTNIFKPRYY